MDFVSQLDDRTGVYGDIFFEDLASVIVQGGRKRMAMLAGGGSDDTGAGSLFRKKISKAALEMRERTDLLRSGQFSVERSPLIHEK